MASCKNDFLCTLKPIACEYSPHFAMSLLVSQQNDTWWTRAEIPHWWQTPFHGGSSGSITISGFKTTKCWEPPLVIKWLRLRERTNNKFNPHVMSALANTVPLHWAFLPFFFLSSSSSSNLFIYFPPRQ